MAKTLVFGLGVSGKAAASWLLKEGKSVIAVDRKKDAICLEEEVKLLISQGLTLCGEDVDLEGIKEVILSPGIPMSHPLVQRAIQKNIEIVGEIEFAFRYIQSRCIGITGSNGKTTTTLMITHVLNACNIPARALGNVGVGLSSALFSLDPKEVLVIELSSFQLEALYAKKLDFACITNITPNHLDRYASMEEYTQAKLRICDCVKSSGKIFSSMPMEKAVCIENKNEEMAFAVCREFGIERSAFEAALQTFIKPPHRLEKVKEAGGVVYYNDSKSSNVESVIFAMQKMQNPVILIVGGVDKGSSYLPWVEAFQGKVKHIVAYGLARDKIVDTLKFAFPCTKIGPFADAVFFACAIAEKNDTVLLSPGCSSYDQFANFEQRGKAFRKLIEDIWTEKKPL